MRGYWGESPAEMHSYSHHWGSLHFTSDRKPHFVATHGKAAMLLEGHLLHFLDTAVPYRASELLQSLLALWNAHGEKFPSKLGGQFLLLFSPDTAAAPLYLVNNRSQAHRLYYTQLENGFYFSSSLRELLERSNAPRTPHFGAIRAFLANGFTSSEQTQIAGVKKLLPADYLVFPTAIEASRALPSLKSYWSGEMRFTREPFVDLETHLDEYERLYRGGLKQFIAAKQDCEVGTLLSGGHDTSFVVAQASQVLKKPLHAYTVSFPGWSFDEGAHAEHIAKKFGAVYHPVPFGTAQVDRVVSLLLANEEPVVGSSLPLHVLSEQAGQEVGLLLGGDGGDTLWGEYYPVEEYHRLTHRLPLAARRMLHGLAKTARDLTDWERFWELEHVACLFTERDYHDAFLRKLCTYRHFSEAYQEKLLLPEIAATPYVRSHQEIPFTSKNFGDALVEGKLFNGFFPYQAFHTAKSAEYYGMELYLPTLNKELMDFICRLPKHWINGGSALQRLANSKKINRRFHKKALSRYLSRNEIYNRSFDIPWHSILKPRTRLLELLRRRLEKRGWYQEAELQRIFSEFQEQRVKSHELLELKHHGYRIFTLLSLEIWCLEYLDGRASSDDKNLALEDYLA